MLTRLRCCRTMAPCRLTWHLPWSMIRSRSNRHTQRLYPPLTHTAAQGPADPAGLRQHSRKEAPPISNPVLPIQCIYWNECNPTGHTPRSPQHAPSKLLRSVQSKLCTAQTQRTCEAVEAAVQAVTAANHGHGGCGLRQWAHVMHRGCARRQVRLQQHNMSKSGGLCRREEALARARPHARAKTRHNANYLTETATSITSGIQHGEEDHARTRLGAA
jgi:hypothetical protein